MSTELRPSETVVRWIPLDISLPKYRERVLLRAQWGTCKPGVKIGYRSHTDGDGEHWSFDGEEKPRDAWKVVAWTPLP
jgi:hypothetical protein